MAPTMIALDPTVPLAGQEDSPHFTRALTAMRQERHMIAQVETILRRGERTWVVCRPVAVTDHDDREAYGHEVFPRSHKKAKQLAQHIAAGVKHIEAAFRAAKKKPRAEDGDLPYKVEANRLWYRGAQGWEPLTNFAAAIKEEVIRDDGAQERGELRIAGALSSGESLGVARVPFGSFPGMSWVTGAWGSRAVVEAGAATRDSARAAIQHLSTDVPRRLIYGHTGFRQIAGIDYFLHAGGAIGPDGSAPGIDVELEGTLGQAVLPDPPRGDDLRQAVGASLALLDIAADPITVPVLGAAYRAPLNDALVLDTSVFLLGATGALKTSLTALAQAHFGARFNDRQLPGSWFSTGNLLEKMIFLAKDIVFVIDDFVPGQSPQEVARARANADRVLRAIGNHAGRGRMNADGSLRAIYVPRGAVISSGEELPVGQSLSARFLVVDVPPGALTVARIVGPQALAEQGVYAAAMAGYIQWLARDYAAIRQQVKARFKELRAAGQTEGVHLRLPANMAQLLVGWEFFLRFAVACGAISARERDGYLERVQEALRTLVTRTAGQVATQDAATRFVTLLASLLSTGKAHLLTRDGMMPENPDRWGWSWQTVGDESVWRPSHQHIGWLEGSDIYLEPQSAYAAVRGRAQAEGTDLGVRPMTQWKRLHEKGLLASRNKDSNIVTRSIAGRDVGVVHIHAAILEHYSVQGSQRSAKSAQSAQDEPATREQTRVSPILDADFPSHGDKVGRQSRQPSANGQAERAARGLLTPPETPRSGGPEQPPTRGHPPVLPTLDADFGSDRDKVGRHNQPASGSTTRGESARADAETGFADFADFSHIEAYKGENTCDGDWTCIGCGGARGPDERLCPGCIEDLGLATQGAAAAVHGTSNGTGGRWQGAVRNVSRDRHIQHPTQPCARGHHEWMFARSERVPALYGYVCRHPECLPLDRYGCFLPVEAYEEVSP